MKENKVNIIKVFLLTITICLLFLMDISILVFIIVKYYLSGNINQFMNWLTEGHIVSKGGFITNWMFIIILLILEIGLIKSIITRIRNINIE